MVLSETTTVEDIIKSFPSYDVKPIEGRPKYSNSKHFLKELGKCAEAIPSHQEKGHWCLTVSPTKCNSATGNDPVIPGQPPAAPDRSARWHATVSGQDVSDAYGPSMVSGEW